MASSDMPNDYRDPAWQSLAAKVEKQYNLPPGVIRSTITHGERSNNDQVSSAGAKTVFQIIPATRDAALDKWGVDAYLSPENAAIVSAKLWKDSLDRNKGNIPLSAAEYNAGTNRNNWSKSVVKYAKSVEAGAKSYQAADEAVAAENAPQVLDDAVHKAYTSGQMSPEDAKAYEDGLASGAFVKPAESGAPEPIHLDAGVYEAYRNGTMAPEDVATFEKGVKDGEIFMPSTATEADSAVANTTDVPMTAEQNQQMQQVVPGKLNAPPELMSDVAARNLLGGADAIAALGTGLTTGAVGYTGGAIAGAGNAIASGAPFGSEQFQNLVQEGARQGGAALSYAPRTQEGQEITDTVGNALQQIDPMVLMAPEAGGVRSSFKASEPLARELAANGDAAIASGVKAIEQPLRNAAAKGDELIAKAADAIKKKEPEAVAQAPDAPRFNVATKEQLADTELNMPIGTNNNFSAATKEKRAQFLADNFGLDEVRNSALEGDRAAIGKDIWIAKKEEGKRMAEQIDKENEALGAYAANTAAKAGGTITKSADERGTEIVNTLADAESAYKERLNADYAAADEAAKAIGHQITLDKTMELLNDEPVFVGENAGTVKKLVESTLKRTGYLNNGKLYEIDAQTANDLKRSLNTLWKAGDKHNNIAISKLKNAIDEDVLFVLPENLYKQATANAKAMNDLFTNPNGISSLLDITGPDGINRAVPVDVVMRKISSLAKTNSAQYKHIMDVLEKKMPTADLAGRGFSASNEIRSHIVEDILSKNFSKDDAVSGVPVRIKGTDDGLSKQISMYGGSRKLERLVGEQNAARIGTLHRGMRMLRPYDPNPSGTSTFMPSSVTRVEKVAPVAGMLIGSGVGSAGGGIAAVGGAVAGRSAGQAAAQAFKGKAINKMIDKSIVKTKKGRKK